MVESVDWKIVSQEVLHHNFRARACQKPSPGFLTVVQSVFISAQSQKVEIYVPLRHWRFLIQSLQSKHSCVQGKRLHHVWINCQQNEAWIIKRLLNPYSLARRCPKSLGKLLQPNMRPGSTRTHKDFPEEDFVFVATLGYIAAEKLQRAGIFHGELLRLWTTTVEDLQRGKLEDVPVSTLKCYYEADIDTEAIMTPVSSARLRWWWSILWN